MNDWAVAPASRSPVAARRAGAVRRRRAGAGHVGEPQAAHGGQPRAVGPAGAALPGETGHRGGKLAEVPGHPVLVQPGGTADRRQALTRLQAGQDERLDVRVAVTAGHVDGDRDDVCAGALPVRPGGTVPGSGSRGGLSRLAAALFRERTAARRGRGGGGQFAPAGPLPSGRAARTDRRVEDQPGRQGGGPQLPGLLPFQGLAPFQPERLAVPVLRPSVRGQMRRHRPEGPPAQMAGHPGAFSHHLADRYVKGGAIVQNARHWPDARHRPGPARWPRHGRYLGSHPASHGFLAC
jgi:hypothetical protein